VPDGPQGGACDEKGPEHEDMARQRLGERVPVKLECDQNLSDNDRDDNE